MTDAPPTEGQFDAARYPLLHPGPALAPAEPGSDRSEPHPVTGMSIPINPDGSTDWARFAGELLRSAGPAGSPTPENGTAKPGGLDQVDDETRLQQVCLALNEPYRTPGDSPREPDWVMTWERALDILAGRTTAWSTLLQRAEFADAEWLHQWRGTLTIGREPEDRRDEPVSVDDALDALCQISHEAYERAAAAAEWLTNPASRVAWADVPESNKVAMRAAVAAVAVRVRTEARTEARAEAAAEKAQLIGVNQSLHADLLRAEHQPAEAVAEERQRIAELVRAAVVPGDPAELFANEEGWNRALERVLQELRAADPDLLAGGVATADTSKARSRRDRTARAVFNAIEARRGMPPIGDTLWWTLSHGQPTNQAVLAALRVAGELCDEVDDTGRFDEAPVDEVPTGEWRVGESYRIHVYAGDRPVATFHQEQDAARAVAAVNAPRGTGISTEEATADERRRIASFVHELLAGHVPVDPDWDVSVRMLKERLMASAESVSVGSRTTEAEARWRPGDLVELDNESIWLLQHDLSGMLIRGEWVPGDIEAVLGRARLLHRNNVWAHRDELLARNRELTTSIEKAQQLIAEQADALARHCRASEGVRSIIHLLETHGIADGDVVGNLKAALAALGDGD